MPLEVLAGGIPLNFPSPSVKFCPRRLRRSFLLASIALASAVFSHAQGYVGLSIGFMSSTTSARYGMTQGTPYVDAVAPGGPGELGGLRAGDLITSVDGVQMRTPNQVVEAFRAHKPGDKARVGIVHLMGSQHMSAVIIVMIGTPPDNLLPAGNAEGGEPGGGGGGHGVARPITAAQQVHRVQISECSAALSMGWQLQTGKAGQSADIYGPGGAHAAWNITGVNPAIGQFYGPMHGPPEQHVGAIIAQLLQAQPQYLSTQDIGGFFTLHEFEAGGNEGVVLYHVYPSPVVGQYIISEYYAWAPQGNERLLSQAEEAMSSLKCMSEPDPQYRSISSGTSPAEGIGMKDYDSILGTQYAHDAAGNLYYLSVDQKTEGPEGYGYYVGTGVNRHKLSDGM
jgi:hypothetical protein